MERRIRGTESEGFKKLHVAADILDGLKVTLHERLGMVQYGRRDMALAAAMANRAFTGMLGTVPLSQLQTMQRNVRHAVYAVGTKRPGGITNEADWGIWVSWDTLNMLIESAKEKCLVCDLPVDKQRQCPLAKALETLPAEKDENAPGCGWYGRL